MGEASKNLNQSEWEDNLNQSEWEDRKKNRKKDGNTNTSNSEVTNRLKSLLSQGKEKEAKRLIKDYEEEMYSKGEYDMKQVKKWKNLILNNLHQKETPSDQVEETVKILTRQIRKLDNNRNILEQGTLKLIGLDFTNEDINNALVETKEKMKKVDEEEKLEYRMILMAFLFFILVCLFVIYDKVF